MVTSQDSSRVFRGLFTFHAQRRTGNAVIQLNGRPSIFVNPCRGIVSGLRRERRLIVVVRMGGAESRWRVETAKKDGR